jgi:uncharacterized protein (DUF433 family)
MVIFEIFWNTIKVDNLAKIIRTMTIFKNIITVESGKRSGKPCIRGMRITVEDILRWLASDMSIDGILQDFPELTREDILTALEFTANRQQRVVVAATN